MRRADTERARVRRLVAVGLVRALAVTVVLVGLYFLLPLDALGRSVDWGWLFTAALVILTVTAVLQLRAVLTSPNPAVRAVEGVAATIPLFVLLFAGTYFVTSQSVPDSFSTTLTRADALYFAVTVFATVGFGDITATAESTRMVVTLQMVLDLIVLGAGVRVFIGAIRLGRERGGSTPAVAFKGFQPDTGSDAPRGTVGGPDQVRSAEDEGHPDR